VACCPQGEQEGVNIGKISFRQTCPTFAHEQTNSFQVKNCPVLLHAKILLLLCLAIGSVAAQEVTVNEQGRRIVVFPDGTWRYFEEDTLRAKSSGLYEPDALAVEKREDEIAALRSQSNQLLLELIQARLQAAEKKMAVDSLRQQQPAVGTEKLILAEAQLSDLLKKEAVMQGQLEAQKLKIQFYESLIYWPEEMRDKKIAEWEKGRAAKNLTEPVANPKQAVNSTAQGSVTDLIMNPPTPPCIFLYEGPDPQTGQQRRDLEPRLFFSHTAKALEEHFKYSDLITCNAYLTAMSGGYQYLNLEIAVASQNALKLYGVMQAGSMADLSLLDGTQVRLLNLRQDGGSWKPRRNAYIYKCSFPLGKKEEKLLRESEIDKIKLRWSLAEEEFEIYELDFFFHLFQCFD
jgi:hypothetical protein